MSSPLSESTSGEPKLLREAKVHSDEELIDLAIRDIMAMPNPDQRIERARRVLRGTNVSALDLAEAILRKERDLG